MGRRGGHHAAMGRSSWGREQSGVPIVLGGMNIFLALKGCLPTSLLHMERSTIICHLRRSLLYTYHNRLQVRRIVISLRQHTT